MNLIRIRLILLAGLVILASCASKDADSRESEVYISKADRVRYEKVCLEQPNEDRCYNTDLPIGGCMSLAFVKKLRVRDQTRRDVPDAASFPDVGSHCDLIGEHTPICIYQDGTRSFNNGGTQLFYRVKNDKYEYVFIYGVGISELPGTDWKICNKNKDVEVPGCQECRY